MLENNILSGKYHGNSLNDELCFINQDANVKLLKISDFSEILTVLETYLDQHHQHFAVF